MKKCFSKLNYKKIDKTLIYSKRLRFYTLHNSKKAVTAD